MTVPNTQLAGLFREQAGRLVAQLIARVGAQHVDDVEDAVQDALLAAMRHWSLQGLPQSPIAWLSRTARNALIDRWRRARFEIPTDLDSREIAANTYADVDEPLASDLLGLLFVCAAPELAAGAQFALMLKLACGLSPAEIAGVLLTNETAILQRIVRAKQTIRARGTLPAFPTSTAELTARVSAVAQCVYLLFSVGYFSTSGARWSQPELCRDALRMARILADDPRTRGPETLALSALLCFSAARLPARGKPNKPPTPLALQDRQLWLRPLIDEGYRRFDRAIGGVTLTRFHIECAIAACHARATSIATTDWSEILSHYDRLCAQFPSPAATLNRLVALAYVRGGRAALDDAAQSAELQTLENSTAYHATLGQLHEDLGARALAAEHYDHAARAAGSETLAAALRERARLLTQEAISLNSSSS